MKLLNTLLCILIFLYISLVLCLGIITRESLKDIDPNPILTNKAINPKQEFMHDPVQDFIKSCKDSHGTPMKRFDGRLVCFGSKITVLH